MSQAQDRVFDFGSCVDLHAVDFECPFGKIVPIASEHGFRGITVTLDQLEEISKVIKNNDSKSHLKVISTIDHPYGNLPIELRIQSLKYAKRKGASEVEISLPYRLLTESDINLINRDIMSIGAVSKELDMVTRYVIDPSYVDIPDKMRNWIYEQMRMNNISGLVNTMESLSGDISLSDDIMILRDAKKCGLMIKAFVSSKDIENIAAYVKAGINILGFHWSDGPIIIHEYEEFLRQQNAT